MPVACAATSSSRIAAQARPSREFSSRLNRITMIAISTSSRYQYPRALSPQVRLIGPMWIPGGGMSNAPRGPLVKPLALLAMTRMISPKPSVTIAR